MNKALKIMVSLIVSIVIAIPLVFISGKFSDKPVNSQTENLSGSYSGTAFSETQYLKAGSGNLKFWVKNNGQVSVSLSIDGSVDKTLSSGEEGYVTTSSGLFSRNYEFKVVPTPNGGDIDIEYKFSRMSK